MIPRSKTDQAEKGNVCAIPYGNSVLCPVTALHHWREESGALSGPIFCQILKGNNQRFYANAAGSILDDIKPYSVS